MKKILNLTLTLIILIISINSVSADKINEKTVIIVLDKLDFKDSEKIINDKLSMGLLNIKTRGKNTESLFVTIAKGRKVQIDDNIFKKIIIKNNIIEVDNYNEIKKALDKSYPNFSEQITSLGEVLNQNDIKTSYMGEKNKSETLIIADNKGEIDYWKQVPENVEDFKKETNNMLEVSDLLLVSLDISEDKSKLEFLSDYLESIHDCNLIIFPRSVSEDVKYNLNDGLVPILYKNNKNKDAGTITSASTKRQGVVSSLDLYPTILNHYNIELKSNIGNNIEITSDEDLLEVNKNILSEFLNLNLIKFIMHGFTIIASLYIAFLSIVKKSDFKKAKILLSSVVISIPISMVLGMFNLHRYMVIYLLLLIPISLLTSVYLQKLTNKSLEKISIITNISILIFIILKPSFIYNSYIGYNSIVSGGRFYGFNNEIMGVFITTSIISYYYFKNKIKNQMISNIFLISYFSIIIMALTGNFGANFGGFLTSITLFLMLIYLSLFNRKINKKTILSLLAIGLLILVSNLYLDMKNDTGSHAGSLIERINILGFYEFIDMIIIKVKQLVYMTIVPPWSIAFLAQTYFVLSSFKAIKNKQEFIPVKFAVMFITSFVVLLVNDTGVVAFVYMNTYLMSRILEER